MNILKLFEEKDLILDYVDKRLYNFCNARDDNFQPDCPYSLDSDFREKVDYIYNRLSRLEDPSCKEDLGLDEWIGFDMPKLEDLLMDTPYSYICMFITYGLLNDQIFIMQRLRYRPAQDYLLLLYCDEKHDRFIGYPADSNIEPDLYIRIVLQALNKIDKHMEEGREKKFYLDYVIIHDELCGTVMDHFDPQMLNIAKEVFDVIDQNSYLDKSNMEDEDGHLTKEFQAEFDRLLNICSEKFVEIGKKYFPDGRLEEGELTYNYLMGHAEEAIWGNWKEEDEAL